MIKHMKISALACLSLVLTLTAAMLSGCTISHTTNSEQNQQKELAGPIAEEYLKNLGESYEITGLTMLKGKPAGMGDYTASYTSDYVAVSAKVDGQSCPMFVNVSTGQIWSGYYSYLVEDMIHDQIEPIFADYGIDNEIFVKSARFQISRFYEEKDLDLEVTLEDCIPSDITPDNFQDKVTELLGDIKLSSITLAYSSPETEQFCPDIMHEFFSDYYPAAYEDAGIPLNYTVINTTEDAFQTVKDNPSIKFPDLEGIIENFRGERLIAGDRMHWKCTYNNGESKDYYFDYQ